MNNCTLQSQPFEQAVRNARFSLARLTDTIVANDKVAGDALKTCAKVLTAGQARKLIQRIVRSCFLIEPVNRDITSTKFACRWEHRPNDFFDFGQQGDPRSASFNSCVELFANLLEELPNLISDEGKKDNLILWLRNNIIAHEAPIDYINDLANPMHASNNVAWIFNDISARTVGLRAFLKSQPEPFDAIASTILNGKISVKTYLTDRAQTGLHQTNREKRWECHPNSVQFAKRQVAWEIELELLQQLFYFDGFPEALRDKALEQGILKERSDVTRCPITQEPLLFEEISAEALNPTHGRSKFQVGHLNPLKAVGRQNPQAGHTAANISWISLDGNRIQGHLSLDETRKLIRKIGQNYDKILDR